MLSTPDPLQFLYLFCFLWASTLLYTAIYSHTRGLSGIPGPWIARYTDAWRAYHAAKGGQGLAFWRKQHEKYGDVIRIGPKTVSVLDAEAIPAIYGLKAKLAKSEAYRAFSDPRIKTGLVSQRDHETHAMYRKPMSSAFSLSSLMAYEPNVDDVINVLAKVLEKHADSGEPINISHWLHYFQFDLLGQLTFGRKLGFLEQGQDINGFIKLARGYTIYVTIVSQMPVLDYLVRDNPVTRRLTPQTNLITDMCRRAVMERKSHPKPESTKTYPDLLSHFFAAQDKFPETMTDTQVVIASAMTVFAGALSPATSYESIFRFLASHPDAQDKLAAELRSASVAPTTTAPASFAATQSLPYLSALIKESYRVGADPRSITLERVVGAGGLDLPLRNRKNSPLHIPAGTNLGISPRALAQRADVFGPDTLAFKPERWFRRLAESDAEFEARRTAMDRNTDFVFSAGSRTCIGKNITHLEFYKVVATLVSLFEYEAVGPQGPFEVNVTVTRRAAKA